MIRITHLLWFLYAILLVWNIYMHWSVGALGWITATLWFFFWMLDQVLDERRKKRTSKSHMADVVFIAKSTARMMGNFIRDIEATHAKHVSKLELRIWELEGTVKVYERNEKDR